ncbi:MAG: YCF48-related protein [Ignavibacteria bacterium]|jgi:photosystem II stability/assembly factor-like uncharacterized protein
MKTKILKLLILLLVFISSYSYGGWVLQNTGSSTFISSISFPNENTGFASGWSSTILKTTNGGTNWAFLSSPVSASFSSIYFVDANTGWLVGSNGAIIKTTNSGQIWQVQTSGTSTLLMLTNFVNAQTGYVVGYSGVIIKTTNGGNNWFSQNSGVSVNLLSVRFINSETGYVTGDYSRILKTTNGGANWESLVSGIYNNLGKIAITDAYTAYVPATDGTVFKTTNGGLYWVAQSSGYPNYLVSANFPSNSTGYISGSNGLVLKTVNGGYNWVGQTTPVSYELHWIYFINSQTGWATGYGGTIIKTTDGGVGYPIPLAPQLLYPANNSMNNSLTPIMQWYSSANATKYHIEISTSPNFNNIVDSATVTTTNYIVPNGKLSTALTYFWRVNASNQSGTSPWSDVWNFATQTGLTAPILLSPPNGIVGVNNTPNLDWDTLPSATKFTIQISTISNFGVITDSTTVTTSQYIVPAGKLQNLITYFWRVNASNAYGSSPWSSVWRFTVVMTGLINSNINFPTEFKLYSNYPNPFNPATKIKFDLPKKTFTSLIVYDALGRSVETLVNTELKEGSYEYTWNAVKYNSGVYFIRIVSDKFVETRKMVLLK